MTVLDMFRGHTPVAESTPLLCALDSFRNPVIAEESGNLEIEPRIGEPQLAGQNPDLTADYIFCNNLSVRASGLANSMNLNWIIPPIQPALHSSNHDLGIWNGVLGNNSEIVVLSIYESIVAKPAISAAQGGQYTRMVICPSPGGGNFQVTTQYSSTGGFPRGIDIAPAGELSIGSNASSAWKVEAGTGSFIPINHFSVDLGTPTRSVQYIYLLGNVFARSAVSPSNPGTDKMYFYVRTGTNANTLKLVVKAGVSGAETTVLDNIPT